MTFTYDISNPNNITHVRYHLSDTVESEAIWTDEDIEYVIGVNDGVWERAVISLIEQYMTTLARTPSFTADWLKVDNSSSINFWRNLLSDKRREFGINKIRATARHVYRVDSLQDSPPDYRQDDTMENT